MLKNKTEKRGIALAFSLVLLSLLLVIGVSFIILASNDRAASAANVNNNAAKLLVQSAINRARVHLLQEINSRQEPTSSSGADDTWAPIADRFFSKVTKAEESNILRTSAAASKKEDLDRILINGAENIGVEWNYITSPDYPGSQGFNKVEDRRVIGRFAFLGFAGAKVSLASTLDSGYKPENKPERYGFGPREIRPEAAFDAEGRAMIPKLAPQTSEYLSIDGNATGEWPDIATVATALGYTGKSDAAKIISLYENLAVGKLPAPECWRMPTYGDGIVGNKLKTYHRFNIHKTQEEWNNFNIENKWNQNIQEYAWINDNNKFNEIADGDIGLYYFAGMKPAALANFQPDDIRKQLFANLKDYNDDDVAATTDAKGIDEYSIENVTYCGLEKVPYISDLRVYYAIKAKSNSGTNTVHASLANIEFEVTNMYLNPDLFLNELVVDVHTDFTATVGGVPVQCKGVQSYAFPATSRDNQGGWCLEDGQMRMAGKNTQTNRQPYLILRDNSGNIIGEPAINSQDVGGTTMTEFRIKKLIIVFRGSGRYGKKSFNNELLHIHRTVAPGHDMYYSGLSYNVKEGSDNRFFVTDQSDDPRCCLISARSPKWNNAEMAGHEGYMEVNFSKTTSTYQWGYTASINNHSTNAEPARYMQQHAKDLNGKSDYCRDPDYELVHYPSGVNSPYRGHPAYMSSCFIRNAPMISPWELGFIHRVRPWQTINLKRYNSEYPITMDFSCDGYVRGDAAILDQIKMTKDYVSYGKVNINSANKAILKTLLSEIKIGAKPWEDDRSIPSFDPNDPPSNDPLVFKYSEKINAPTEFLNRDPIRKLGPSEPMMIPDGKLENYAEALERYIQTNRVKDGWSDWFSRARIVDAFRDATDAGGGKLDIIADLYEIHGDGKYDATQMTVDVWSEELIGKVINLLEAETGREAAVLCVAQSILDAKNSSGQYGTYEPGADRIVGEAKVLAVFEYWPKTTPPQEGGENAEYKRSDWVLTKVIQLDPTTGGL